MSGTLIAICGPDIRWVGNESGVAREDESSVVKRGEEMVWHPAECDVSIRPGWFYHSKEDAQVKSLEALADIYESIEELKYYRGHFLKGSTGA